MTNLAAGQSNTYSGIAPDAYILNAKVLNDKGVGRTSQILEGIQWAIDNQADILLMSFGGPYNNPQSPINFAIRDAVEAGITVVVSAGNCGPDCPSRACGSYVGITTPGNSLDAISVGSLDRHNNPACFSSRGDQDLLKPDIVTLGIDISSLYINNYKAMNGTSISAAHVAGAAALLLEANPQLEPSQVKAVLSATATDLGPPGKDVRFGWGSLNIREFIDKLDEAQELYDNFNDPASNLVRIPIDLNNAEEINNTSLLQGNRVSGKIFPANSDDYVNILLDVIDFGGRRHEVGDRVYFTIRETIDPDNTGFAYAPRECELIFMPHKYYGGDCPHYYNDQICAESDRARRADFIDTLVGGQTYEWEPYFDVLDWMAQYNDGVGKFEASIYCYHDYANQWQSDWAYYTWTAENNCRDPAEPTITIKRVYHSSYDEEVVYSTDINNNLCRDFGGSYNRKIDYQDASPMILVGGIAPQSTFTSSSTINLDWEDITLNDGSHTLKLCLTKDGFGGPGFCDTERFTVGGFDEGSDGDSDDDQQGVVDPQLNYPAGHSCDGNEECATPYCVHGTCRYSHVYCGDSYCDTAELAYCDQDCTVPCFSDVDCGNDGYVTSAQCGSDDNVHLTYRTYRCNNPSTQRAYCSHSEEDRITETCTQGCHNGNCELPSNCDSNSDCGNNGYTGNTFCYQNKDVYQTYRRYICRNPGTSSSSCDVIDDDRLKETCPEDCQGGSCKEILDYNWKLEYSNKVEKIDNKEDIKLIKQPGDYISIILNSEGPQTINFNAPQEFEIADGIYSPGRLTVNGGDNSIKFHIPKDVFPRIYTFSSGGDRYKVKIIEKPKTLILTDSIALENRYRNFQSNNINYLSILEEAYKTAASEKGIVYNINDYRDQVGERPSALNNYQDNPKYQYNPESINNYALKIGDLTRKKCSDCDVIILGDDFVIPHYRRKVDWKKWHFISSTIETHNIYSDVPYIQNTKKPFSQFQDLFVGYDKYDDPTEGKDIYFIQQDDFSSSVKQEVNKFGDALDRLGYEVDITMIDDDNITCNDPGWWDNFNDKTLFIFGPENEALKCFPFVRSLEDSATIEVNPWDGNDYAVIIQSEDELVLQTIRNIIENEGAVKLIPEWMVVIETGIDWVSYTSMMVGLDTFWDPVDTTFQCGIKGDVIGCGASTAAIFIPLGCSAAVKKIIKPFLKKFEGPITKIFLKNPKGMVNLFDKLINTNKFTKFDDSLEKVADVFPENALDNVLKNTDSVDNLAKGAESFSKRGEKLENFNPSLKNIDNTYRAELLLKRGKYAQKFMDEGFEYATDPHIYRGISGDFNDVQNIFEKGLKAPNPSKSSAEDLIEHISKSTDTAFTSATRNYQNVAVNKFATTNGNLDGFVLKIKNRQVQMIDTTISPSIETAILRGDNALERWVRQDEIMAIIGDLDPKDIEGAWMVNKHGHTLRWEPNPNFKGIRTEGGG